MKQKIIKTIEIINLLMFLLAIVLVLTQNAWGTPVFLTASCLGFVMSIKHRNIQGTILNSAFIFMNSFLLV